MSQDPDIFSARNVIPGARQVRYFKSVSKYEICPGATDCGIRPKRQLINIEAYNPCLHYTLLPDVISGVFLSTKYYITPRYLYTVRQKTAAGLQKRSVCELLVDTLKNSSVCAGAVNWLVCEMSYHVSRWEGQTMPTLSLKVCKNTPLMASLAVEIVFQSC